MLSLCRANVVVWCEQLSQDGVCEVDVENALGIRPSVADRSLRPLDDEAEPLRVFSLRHIILRRPHHRLVYSLRSPHLSRASSRASSCAASSSRPWSPRRGASSARRHPPCSHSPRRSSPSGPSRRSRRPPREAPRPRPSACRWRRTSGASRRAASSRPRLHPPQAAPPPPPRARSVRRSAAQSGRSRWPPPSPPRHPGGPAPPPRPRTARRISARSRRPCSRRPHPPPPQGAPSPPPRARLWRRSSARSPAPACPSAARPLLRPSRAAPPLPPGGRPSPPPSRSTDRAARICGPPWESVSVARYTPWRRFFSHSVKTASEGERAPRVCVTTLGSVSAGWLSQGRWSVRVTFRAFARQSSHSAAPGAATSRSAHSAPMYPAAAEATSARACRLPNGAAHRSARRCALPHAALSTSRSPMAMSAPRIAPRASVFTCAARARWPASTPTIQ
eukprot:165279-Prorocentrum_minimum.AAC.1